MVQLLVVTVSSLSLLAHGLAAGLIGATDDSRKSIGNGKRRRSGSPAVVARRQPSFLDRIQKDAQSNELEPANTHPVFFFFLVVAQTLAVAAFCQWGPLPLRFHTAALLSLGSHWIGFVISVREAGEALCLLAW